MMAFTGAEPVRAKISLDEKIIDQVSTFKYLGGEISYRNNRDVEEKLNMFCLFCDTIRHT